MNSVLIVDDHILFREGLHKIIEHWDDFEVVGEAGNGQEGLEIARETIPDIVLMDIAMPVLDGIEATRKLTRELPSVKVVILTMSEEQDNLFEALKSGAHGYLLKDTPSRRLHQKLRGLLQGEAPLSALMATKILQEFNRPREMDISPNVIETSPLTSREQQVLELVAQGLSNPEISERLYLSVNTVKKYIHNVLEKLHLNNRVEAAIYAVKSGLIDSETMSGIVNRH